jgi:hypothetical protein
MTREELVEKIVAREEFLRARVTPWTPEDAKDWPTETLYFRDIDPLLDELYKQLDEATSEEDSEDVALEKHILETAFDFLNSDNPRDVFSREVALLVSRDVSNPELRIQAVDKLVESYIEQTEERPEPAELDELAGWIIWGPTGTSTRKQKQGKLVKKEAI